MTHEPTLREIFGLEPATRTERVAEISRSAQRDLTGAVSHEVFATLPPELQQRFRDLIDGFREIDLAIAAGEEL